MTLIREWFQTVGVDATWTEEVRAADLAWSRNYFWRNVMVCRNNEAVQFVGDKIVTSFVKSAWFILKS